MDAVWAFAGLEGPGPFHGGAGEAERGIVMGEGADKTICWCFGYSLADIEADLARNDGRSRLMEGIAAAKAVGGCRCAAVNPSGR